MNKGRIKMFNEEKGYGFIKKEKNNDIFMHISQWRGASTPEIGQRVQFTEGEGRKGKIAKKVVPVGEEINEEEYRFLNPYNFVRNMKNKRLESSVLGICSPPPHDRYVGLSGRIECNVEVVTPLFVSDSHEIVEEGDHKTYRFFQVQGKPAIPGSSLRGMIRSVYETITDSCLSIFQKDTPYPMEHRPSRSPKKMIPARVVAMSDEEAELELLDCTRNPREKIQRGTTLINSGAICESYPPKVLNIRSDKTYNPVESILPQEAYDGMRVAALVARQPVTHRSGFFRFFQVTEVVPADQYNTLNEDDNSFIVFGWIHLTGPNIENKHDERLFFRWDDTEPNPPERDAIPKSCIKICSKEVIKEYNQHLKEYWERHEKTVERLQDKNKRWPKSLKDLPQPSTFVEKDRKLQVGDPLYVILKNGTPSALRPVSMPRIRYKYLREELLQKKHIHCTLVGEGLQLCPACRVFGWVGDEKEMKQEEITAYAGRVTFSYGEVKDSWETEKEITMAILSTPKPTTTSFYLLDSNREPDPKITYDQSNTSAHLRGRKFYYHQSSRNSDTAQKSDQNRTIQGAIKRGTFTFTVDYKNLAPLELGALLYALELEEGMFHRLGYGKPLGFGSVKVKVNRVGVIDWTKRLQSIALDAGVIYKDREWIEKVQKDFLQKMQDLYGEEYHTLLEELKALLGNMEELPVHYPRPTEVFNPDRPQFEWFVGNKRRIQLSHREDVPDPVALGLADGKKELPIMDRRGN